MIGSISNSTPKLSSSKLSSPAKSGKSARTAENAITEELTKKIQDMAKEDAKKGIYMGNEFCQVTDAHMRKFVSPDRAGPIAQANAMMNRLFDEHAPMLELLDRLLGNNTVKIQHDPTCHGQTAEIRDSNGEVIATYNTFGGGWCPSQTKEEGKFYSETAAIYAEAFKAARAEMKAEGQAPAESSSSSVDLRA